MTRTDTRPARYTYPDLCHVEALIEAHASIHISVWDDAGHLASAAKRDELVAARDELLAGVRGMFCRKCDGRGVTQFRHRLDGVCFQCNGTGWSAKGRAITKAKD